MDSEKDIDIIIFDKKGELKRTRIFDSYSAGALSYIIKSTLDISVRKDSIWLEDWREPYHLKYDIKINTTKYDRGYSDEEYDEENQYKEVFVNET